MSLQSSTRSQWEVLQSPGWMQGNDVFLAQLTQLCKWVMLWLCLTDKRNSLPPHAQLWLLQNSNNRFWHVLPTHKVKEDAEKPEGTY